MIKTLGFICACLALYIGISQFSIFEKPSSSQDNAKPSQTQDLNNTSEEIDLNESSDIELTEETSGDETAQENEAEIILDMSEQELLNTESTIAEESDKSSSVTYIVSASFAEKISAKGLLRLLQQNTLLQSVDLSIQQDAYLNFGIAITAIDQQTFEEQYQLFLQEYHNLKRANGPVLI